MHDLSLFSKEFTKLCVKFLRVWTKNTIGWEILEKILKTFDENSIDKWNFYLFFWEKLLLKIESSEIASFFTTNSSGSGGGEGLKPPSAYVNVGTITSPGSDPICSHICYTSFVRSPQP